MAAFWSPLFRFRGCRILFRFVSLCSKLLANGLLMVSLRLYLDTRAVKRGEPAPLKVVFTKKGVAAWLSLGIRLLPSQWDRDRQRVVGHPQKDAYNSFLLNRMAVIQNLVLSLTSSGDLAGLSSLQVKDKVAALLDPESGSENLFVARFEAYGSRQKALRTREIYATTLKKILAFDHKARSLSFSDVNKDWLSRFDAWLVPSCPSKNGRNIHLRNIRAVFNDAIDNEVTSAYPFRRFKIRPAATVKRAVSVETLRAIFDYPVEPWQRRYVDAFRLVFCLIGINVVDLLDAAPLVDGRLAYLRSKTGRLYDIKVEPEALEIIRRYSGRDHLVSFGEGRKSYKSFTMQLDRALQSIGSSRHEVRLVDGKKKKVKVYDPAFPGLTSYVARHSWATIAASLDVPKETISKALGHGGSSVTDIYIDFDMRKVDEANRRVLDWVFYGKK